MYVVHCIDCRDQDLTEKIFRLLNLLLLRRGQLALSTLLTLAACRHDTLQFSRSVRNLKDKEQQS